jgi:hypothetical protein
MSAVGIVSIAVGILAVCGRGALLLAPAATLRWFKRQVETNGRVRVMAVIGLILGAAMLWAGNSDDSVLATVLTVFGIGALGVSVLTILFPGGYREFADALLPEVESANLTRWRMLGLAGVGVGVLLIYFGVLAL